MGRVPAQQSHRVEKCLRQEALIFVGLNGDVAEPLRQLLAFVVKQKGEMGELWLVELKHLVKQHVLWSGRQPFLRHEGTE